MFKVTVKLNNHGWTRICRLSCVFVLLAIFTSPSFSSSYKEAYKNYARRNLNGCIKSASTAIKRTKNRSQLSDLFKLSGICYHQLKNNGAATKMFKNAIRFNPSAQVSASEVLDPSVVSFFKQVKSSSQGGAISKSARPAKRQVAKSSYAKSAKSTSLIVNSNLPSALLMIDGIIVGRPGAPIEVDPGNNVITLSQKGYITRKVKVFVKKNQQMTITVNLSKPKPKPKPKPKKRRSRRPSNRGQVSSGIALPSTGIEGVTPSQPQTQNQMPPQFEGQGAYPLGSTQPTYQQPTYQQQPGYPQPGYPQPGYPQPGYPQPGYPQPGYPQPGYPQPAYPQPTYQQPLYAAPPSPAPVYPPSYNQPTPSYAAPSAAPIDAGLPPIDNNEGNIFNDSVKNYYDSGEDDIFSEPKKSPKIRKRKSRKRGSRKVRKSKPISRSSTYKSIGSRRTKKKNSKSMFVALLPLGAGQFQNDDYILGSVFAASQLGTAVYAYMLNEESTTRTQALNTYITEAQTEDGLNDEQTTYINAEKASIEEIQTNRTYMLAGALISYAASVTEAILSIDDKPKSSKKKRRRSYVSHSPTSIPLATLKLSPPSKNTDIFDLGLEIDRPEGENSSYLVTKFNWTF